MEMNQGATFTAPWFGCVRDVPRRSRYWQLVNARVASEKLFPAVTALVSHESDPSEVGQTMGVQQAFGGVARVVGPMWATPVFQLLGPAFPFVIAAGIVAFTGLMTFRVPVQPRAASPAPAG